MIDHGESVGTVLVVDAGPLVVLIVHMVDVTMDDRRHHVYEEEYGHGGEDKAHPVTGQTNVDHTVSLKRAEGFPQAPVVRCARERCLLFAKAWNVKIDAGAQLWLDFHTLDHLDKLSLLFVGLRVVGPDLPQVLVNIVLHFY